MCPFRVFTKLKTFCTIIAEGRVTVTCGLQGTDEALDVGHMYMTPWTLEKLISHLIAVLVHWFASLLLLLPSVGPLVFSLNLAFSTGMQWLLDSPDDHSVCVFQVSATASGFWLLSVYDVFNLPAYCL